MPLLRNEICGNKLVLCGICAHDLRIIHLSHEIDPDNLLYSGIIKRGGFDCQHEPPRIKTERTSRDTGSKGKCNGQIYQAKAKHVV